MSIQLLKSENRRNKFFGFAKITLLLIYLVIVAGSVVRMSGAGMGCPDWPMCFDQVIPPTSVDQLPENYQEIYAERGYKDTTFNAFHTWTEYINRLVGAVAGFFCLILAIWSVRFAKSDPWVCILSFLVLFAMGFQGWLGAVVVYSVLQPFKISIHMLMALVIVAMMLHLLIRQNLGKLVPLYRNDPTFKRIAYALLITVLIQIVVGTQLREEIDVVSKTLGESARNSWIGSVGWVKLLHRSFAWVPVALAGWLWFHSIRRRYQMNQPWFILAIILVEVVLGIVLYYLGMPKWAQPLHLVLATVLFGANYWFCIKLSNFSRN